MGFALSMIFSPKLYCNEDKWDCSFGKNARIFSNQTCPYHMMQRVFPEGSVGFHMDESAFCIPVPYSTSGSSAMLQHFSCSLSFITFHNLSGVSKGFYFIAVSPQYPANE